MDAYNIRRCVAVLIVVTASNLHSQPLQWKALDGAPLGHDVTALGNPGQGGRAPKLVHKQTGQKTSPRLLDPKVFFSSRSFSADLPSSVRAAPTFVRFLVGGTAKADPEEGTILNIDGAILGFRLLDTGASGPQLAEVMAVADFADGKRVWKSAGVFATVDRDSRLTNSPPLAVRLDHSRQSWAVYVDDLETAKDLPLFSQGKPSVKLRAGSTSGDMAMVKDIAVKPPSNRPRSPIRAVDGQIDLAAEHRKGTPGVYLGTKPEGR